MEESTGAKSTGLRVYASNITSSHGEDGIIERIFEVIGSENKWCVELGALNGKHDSNVWSLVKQKGWNGVLIEADQTYFEKLVDEYADRAGAHCINEFVSFEGEQSLDAIFARTSLPKQFDLFSLDIDGNDYHLWESLVEYTPRVMVVEFNPSIPNDVEFVQPRDMNVYQGSSLRALVTLGKKKGYELVCANESNGFFVREDLFPQFAIADNAIDIIRTDHQFETKLFQLYDGTLRLSGNTRLLWHNLPIDTDKLQVLPPSKRRYPANISPKSFVRRLKFIIRKMPLYPQLQRMRKALGV